MAFTDQEIYAIALERISECARTGNAVLDLKNIGLRVCPPEVGDLIHLKTVNLGYNHLAQLPESLNNLARGTSVVRYGNPIKEGITAQYRAGLFNWLDLEMDFTLLRRDDPWVVTSLGYYEPLEKMKPIFQAVLEHIRAHPNSPLGEGNKFLSQYEFQAHGLQWYKLKLDVDRYGMRFDLGHCIRLYYKEVERFAIEQGWIE